MTGAGAAEAAAEPRQHLRFLWLYALAVAGGAVAYVPFLTLLLPLRVADYTDGNPVASVAYAAFIGAIAASIANIGFGWASDRTRRRRPWIWGGLALSALLLVAMRWANALPELLALLIAWQVALNMMLAPLAAWAGDRVPDAQKGFLGGLLAFAPALGALSGALITWPGLADPDMRLVLVAGLMIAMIAPVLFFGDPAPMPQLAADAPQGANPQRTAVVRRMWAARLLVQIAEAALFAYLLYWLRSLDPGFAEARVAQTFSFVLVGAVPVALLVGRWSDRTDRPILPLGFAALGTGLGLLAMAAAPTLAWAIAGYVLFGLASSVFLSLHSAQTLRVLPHAATRGRDLGIFNLTNTVPSLIMPWLSLALVPSLGFDALFAVLAGLCAAACVLLFSAARIRRG